MAVPGTKRMFNTTKKGNPDDFYPKIIIYKAKRAGFLSFCSLIFAAMVLILFVGLQEEMMWTSLVLPLLGLGLLIIIYPVFEEWLYRPWQERAQQVEWHSNE